MSDHKETHYINGYHPSVLKTHNQRTAQDSCQFLLPTLHTLSSKTPGFKLLDAGCGPGSITLSLATLFPSSKITALDLSDAALKPARESAAEKGISNISFVTGDVYALPFEDGTFDVVHAQQLLCHVPDAVAAIEELIRVTKPGGKVGLREGDARAIFFWPELDLLKKSWDLFARQMDGEGGTGDARAGRKLRGWVRDAGVRDGDVAISAGTWSYSSEAERQMLGQAWMERVVKSEFAVKVVEQGQATQEEMQEIREAWKQWSQDPNGFLCIPHGEALISVIS